MLAAPLGVPGSRTGLAHSYAHGTIMIGHLWSPPGSEADAPVYGPIVNTGAEPDRLVAATCPVASAVRFRRVEDGRAVFLDAIDLAPNAPLALAEWRVHLWIEGLTVDRAEGGAIALALTFEHAGTIEVESVIETQPGH